MDKKTEALKLALKRAFNLGQTYWQQADSEYTSQWKKADVTLASFNQLVEDTIREALMSVPDGAQSRSDEEQPAPGSHLTDEQKAANGLAWLARLEALREEFAGLAEQPAQQEPVRVPVTDNTYNYAKSLAEAIFKQHFASDEHYASGRIVWGVNDTVIGILTQIDNMVADMVRRPAQQQPLTDEQIADILPDDDTPMSLGEAFVKFARAIEAAHGIKA